MNPFIKDRLPLLVAAVALFALPFVMPRIGLGVTSATEVVIFAMACMALNILVGYTGLVSFGTGHGSGSRPTPPGSSSGSSCPAISRCRSWARSRWWPLYRPCSAR